MPVIESEVVLLESQAALAQFLAMWPTSSDRRQARKLVQPPMSPAVIVTVKAIQPRPSRTPAAPEPVLTRQSRSRLCICGTCGRCVDNAKWNRIFADKFADSSYYGSIFTRHNSSLGNA